MDQYGLKGLAELLADWNGCNGDRYMRAWDFEDNTVSYDVTLYAKWTPASAAPSFATQSLILDGKIVCVLKLLRQNTATVNG